MAEQQPFIPTAEAGVAEPFGLFTEGDIVAGAFEQAALTAGTRWSGNNPEEEPGV